MPRQPKPAGNQAARKEPDPVTLEGIHHDHHDDDGRIVESHLHRLGNLRHIHLEDGKVEFADGRPAEVITPTDPPTGFGHDQFGTDPDTGTYHPAPESRRAVVTTAEARERLRDQTPNSPLDSEVLAQARTQAREQGVARRGPSETDQADLAIGDIHPDVLNGSQPRPVAVSGAPGSRLSDVASRVIHLTMDGYPATVHDEVIWTEIATHALVSMREDQARTKGPSDPALVAAALDAVDHIARARGLVRGGGGS